ncbi:membrane protein insertase YidC [Aerophototrophica crusticola]|uniref:Membrane protein insertase YidC n=1 Tax=Aerophototrophica crusticola TaxID=1709002 RepID=A0A858R3C1_9PROT|nr:membrane protein insertase YidC [Rhodospirillaceae bacterium B3]
MTDQKNLLLAIAISVAILFGFHFFYELPRQRALQAEQARQQALVEQQAPAGPAADPTLPQATVPGQAPGSETVVSNAPPAGPRERTVVLGETQRLKIDTPRIHGSVNLRGGRFDDLTLANYRVTPEPASAEVVLLAPTGSESPYFAEFGWIGAGGLPANAVPGPGTEWTASGGPLGVDKPVTLTWDNGQGLVFERVINVDQNFMFTVTQRVRNNGAAPVTLQPYGRVQRIGTPTTSGFYVLHEGPIGVIDGVLQEPNYTDLKEDGAEQKFSTTGGWFGFTDKYWLVSLVPDQGAQINARLFHQRQAAGDVYQFDFTAPALTVAPGAAAESTNRLFAGAKEVNLLEEYRDSLGIPRFNYAVDWGWFYFFTIPFFHALDFLRGLVGNFGVAILVFTVLLRLAFFPIANKQYEAFAKLKKLQPKMEEIRKVHGDNRERMSMEMMKLYKEEKANPLGGCLPILLQIPVFFALYKVLFVTIEMRHAPFFGWIQDLSAPDPTTLFNLFGLIPWDPPAILHIGVWPILMGVTMWLQQKLNPSQPDPVQQKVFMALPFIFTYMMAAFPAGLVIYWTWSNLLSIAQQWFIMRRMGVKVT